MSKKGGFYRNAQPHAYLRVVLRGFSHEKRGWQLRNEPSISWHDDASRRWGSVYGFTQKKSSRGSLAASPFQPVSCDALRHTARRHRGRLCTRFKNRGALPPKRPLNFLDTARAASRVHRRPRRFRDEHGQARPTSNILLIRA
jgi:hypothetical protein